MDNIDQKDANLKEIARGLYAQIEQMDSSKRVGTGNAPDRCSGCDPYL